MKFRELLISWLSETTLFEMAYSRKKAWERVSSLTGSIGSHIIKLLIMPQSQHRQHWKLEIEGWINGEHGLKRIVLKPDNRRLTLEEYRNWMIQEPECQIDKDVIRFYTKQYPNEKIVIATTLQQDFDHIMERIVYLLAVNEYVDMDEVIEN